MRFLVSGALLLCAVCVCAAPRAVADADAPGPPSGSVVTPAAPEPAKAATPPAAAPAEPSEDETRAKLDTLMLRSGGSPMEQTTYYLKLAWDASEPDAAMKKMAIERLRRGDPRLIAEGVTNLMPTSPPEARIGMLQTIAECYSKLGGENNLLDRVIAQQIRSNSPDVARLAMGIVAHLRISDGYIPLREVASRPGDPLRTDAILNLALMGDPRAVGFFSSLLDSGSAPRAEIYTALSTIGRPAALVLKSKMDSSNPQVRLLAIGALLPIATPDDLSALYAWIQKYPPQGDLRKSVYEKIAALEAQQFARPLNDDSN